MRNGVIRASILALCACLPACGPLLDYRDSVTGVLGGYTPYGYWKRDFWGEKHFHPYPSKLHEPAPDNANESER